MSIDWSKAPFDAEAGTAKSDHYFAAWYRRDGNGQVQQICHEAGFKEWTWMGGRKDFPVGSELRPKAVVPWSGEGLPPVGVPIEAKNKNARPGWARSGFYETVIVAIGKQLVIFEADGNGSEKVGKLSDYIFRPIRTAEQIAAEERAAAVEDMWNTYWKPEPQTAKEALGLLWDAGWRKQVQP